MYFHGVKSTAHPPIIGLLGQSTNSVENNDVVFEDSRSPLSSGVSGPPAVAVHGVAPAAGLRYFPYGQNMQSI